MPKHVGSHSPRTHGALDAPGGPLGSDGSNKGKGTSEANPRAGEPNVLVPVAEPYRKLNLQEIKAYIDEHYDELALLANIPPAEEWIFDRAGREAKPKHQAEQLFIGEENGVQSWANIRSVANPHATAVDFFNYDVATDIMNPVKDVADMKLVYPLKVFKDNRSYDKRGLSIFIRYVYLITSKMTDGLTENAVRHFAILLRDIQSFYDSADGIEFHFYPTIFPSSKDSFLVSLKIKPALLQGLNSANGSIRSDSINVVDTDGDVAIDDAPGEVGTLIPEEEEAQDAEEMEVQDAEEAEAHDPDDPDDEVETVLSSQAGRMPVVGVLGPDESKIEDEDADLRVFRKYQKLEAERVGDEALRLKYTEQAAVLDKKAAKLADKINQWDERIKELLAGKDASWLATQLSKERARKA